MALRRFLQFRPAARAFSLSSLQRINQHPSKREPKRKNRALHLPWFQSITNCSFSISLTFILLQIAGGYSALSLRNRRQLCMKPPALNPGVVALSSFSKAMRPDISLPDAPLGACPAAFLTAQAALIAELHAQAGGARWGVPLGDFAGALYRSAVRNFDGAPPEGDALGTYLRGLHLGDLALSCALQLGSEAAWEDLVLRFRPALYAAARAIAGARGEAYARELADALYGELYGFDRDASGRRRSLLRYFHGRSKLLTWLRTVLAQRHVDSLRAGRNMDSLEDEVPDSGTGQKRGRTHTALFITSGPSGACETGDPDRARLLPRLQETLLVAFEALAPSDRLLLAMYYLDEQTLAQIARMRRVHEATVSRQLERIRRELRERVESALAAAPAGADASQNGTVGRKGLSAAEIDLCLQYAVEDGCFDVSEALSRNKLHTAIQQPKSAVQEQDEKG